MAEKGEMDHVEAPDRQARDRSKFEHGDRALAVIGDERVVVSEEDVCILPC